MFAFFPPGNKPGTVAGRYKELEWQAHVTFFSPRWSSLRHGCALQKQRLRRRVWKHCKKRTPVTGPKPNIYIYIYILVCRSNTWAVDMENSGDVMRAVSCATNIGIDNKKKKWLVVSTPLKNISQSGWLFPFYGEIKLMFQTTNQRNMWTSHVQKTGKQKGQRRKLTAKKERSSTKSRFQVLIGEKTREKGW